MRIRQVKPAFWTDGKTGRLPAATRLFYIGCWMLADDAGWFDWSPAEIGAELYPFEGAASRERRIAAMGEELDRIGCIVVYTCGHAEVPHLVEHQRLAGPTKRVDSTQKRHLNGCPAYSRGFPRIPALARARRNGQERLGKDMVSIPAEVAGIGEDDGSQAIETRRLPLVEVLDPATGATSWVATSGKPA